MTKNKILFVFLVLIIIFGVFLRTYALGSQFLEGDESITVIASMKFAHSSFRDFVSYTSAAPPFGRIITGIPSFFIDSDYRIVNSMTPMGFIYNYAAYKEIINNYIPMRFIIAIAGILSLGFIYLITRDLFGKYAALWSTALSAISFDLIIWSRILYMSSFIVFFSLGTIFFFMKYVKSKLKLRRYLYLGLTFLFLFFAIGSHHVQPWFLIPMLIISQFIFNKNKKENILVSLGYIGAFVLMWLIYTYYSIVPIFGSIALTYVNSNNFINVILAKLGFSFHNIILGFLMRNNYVLGLVSLICIILFFNLIVKKTLIEKIKDIIRIRYLKLIILLLFIIPFIGLGVTVLGGKVRQLVFLFIPLYIFSGFIVEKITRKKIILFLVVILMLINGVQLINDFPQGMMDYSNLGKIERFKAWNYNGSGNQEVLDYLEEIGNPTIMSNHMNTMVFYNGTKLRLIIPSSNFCKPELFLKLKALKIFLLYQGPVNEDHKVGLMTTYFNETYFCKLIADPNFEHFKEFRKDLNLYRIV